MKLKLHLFDLLWICKLYSIDSDSQTTKLAVSSYLLHQLFRTKICCLTPASAEMRKTVSECVFCTYRPHLVVAAAVRTVLRPRQCLAPSYDMPSLLSPTSAGSSTLLRAFLPLPSTSCFHFRCMIHQISRSMEFQVLPRPHLTLPSSGLHLPVADRH
jgi:hypothetical protein